MSPSIILYGHPTCPNMPPVRLVLWLSKVNHQYINIHQDTDAATKVREINNGYESVPTLVFPDGSTLTEPTTSDLRHKLEASGYRFNPLAYIAGNLWFLLGGILFLIAIIRALGVF